MRQKIATLGIIAVVSLLAQAQALEVPQHISSPTRDCSFSLNNDVCSTPDGNFPADLCNGVYGSCPEKPLDAFATPCESLLKYNKCSTYVDCTADEDGFPKWAKSPGNDAVGRTTTSLGAGQMVQASLLRYFGNDDTCDAGGTPGKCRNAAYPKTIDKDRDVCLWRAEAAMHVTATGIAGARFPHTVDSEGKEGTERVFGGVPSLLIQSQTTVPPDAMEYASTYDGTQMNPGAAMHAPALVRSTVMPDAQLFATSFENRLEPKLLAGVSTFQTPDWRSAGKEGKNAYYDRGPKNPIRLAQDKLFMTTPSYATYDPNDYRPGQEHKLAAELAEKTPEEIARMKDAGKFGLIAPAYAASGNAAGNIKGIMSRLSPRVAPFSAHFDDPNITGGAIFSSYFAGMPRDNVVNTPGVKVLPGLAEKMPQLSNVLHQIGGSMMGDLLSQLVLNKNVGDGPISRAGYLRCLNAMDDQVIGDKLEDYTAKAYKINASCPKHLLSCLQSQGGYGGAQLNSCFQSINKVDLDLKPVNVSIQNPGVRMMSKAASYIFNGNPKARSGKFTPFNIGTLGGGDVGKLNDILMQRIPGLPKVGDLGGNMGQFFGNEGKMGTTLASLKQHPYVQMNFPSHSYDVRAMTRLFPERDHYSPCTSQKKCFVSINEAPFAFFTPWDKGGGQVTATPDQTITKKQIEEYKRNLKESDSKDCFGPSCSAEAIGMPKEDNEDESAQKHTPEPLFENPSSLISRLTNVTAPDSPLNFGPNPSHIAIGMPKTTEETGALLFRKDGSAYYANKPEEPVNFINKQYYTKEDVEKGILPDVFADYVPESTEEPFTKLAMVISEKGGIHFMPPDELEAMVAELNQNFKKMGSSALITSNVFQQAAADYQEFLSTGQVAGLNLDDMSANGLPNLPSSATSSKVSALLESIGVSPALAAGALPSGANIGSMAKPPVPKERDAVYCSGKRTFNQFACDALKPRYERFNAHILLRILMNRWWYADGQDIFRCTPLGSVCAPKPCLGFVSAWSKQCWRGNGCSPESIKAGPSDAYPPAAVRYDVGGEAFDIAYRKPINSMCGRIKTPAYETHQGTCHFYSDKCPTTRGYNCRNYFGEKICSYSWAFHADGKYILKYWAQHLGGDFVSNAGENNIMHECHQLCKPIRTANKHRFGSMLAADEDGMQIAPGTSFTEYFGVTRPYIAPDNLGHEVGGTPGQWPDYSDSTGAYIFANISGSGDDPVNDLMAAHMPMSSRSDQPKSYLANLLERIAPSANAAKTTPNTGSSGLCWGGSMPEMNGDGCPKANGGLDPQVNNLERGLMQSMMVREYGLNGMPTERVLFSKGPQMLYNEMCGATVSMEMEKDGEGTGILRQVAFPQPAENNVWHPTEPWGSDMEEKTGGDEVLALGAKAACTVIKLPQGGGLGPCNGPDSECGFPIFAVVTEVNERQGWIRAAVNQSGRAINAAGLTENAGTRIERTFYKPGKYPETLRRNVLDGYETEPKCHLYTTEQLTECEVDNWDAMQVLIPKDDAT